MTEAPTETPHQQSAPDAVSCAGNADSGADSPSSGVSAATPTANRHSDAIFVPAGWQWSTEAQALVRIDGDPPATGTEAQVCADIAKRQRRGLAKYGVTVIANNLSFAQWLQHFYEELLDASVYAKRILTTMNHEPENQTENNGGAPSVLPDNAPPVNRHRKPGAGRKAKPCPGCGATKSIGSTVKAGIPTRRCKQCGFVVQTYPHLANGKAPA